MRHFDIVKFFEKKFNYQSYLEIGCANDDTFKRIECPIKVGVDPNRGGTIRTTSDDFFRKNTEKFDLIFIDGLHLHEQVIRDINNSLIFLNENGIILVHDCNPDKIAHQYRHQITGIWNGDVWKAICWFRQRKDLNIYVTQECSGVGIIRKQPNENILVLKTKIKNITWSYFVNNRDKLLNLKKWEDIKKDYREGIYNHKKRFCIL